MVATWFAQRQGKAGVRPDAMLIHTKWEAADIKFANPSPVRNSDGWPRTLGSHLGCVLGFTGHVVALLAKSPYFQSNSAFMAMCRSPWALQWPLFLRTQSAGSTEGSVDRARIWARAPASRLTEAWQFLVSQNMKNNEAPWALGNEPKCLPIYI